MWVRALGVATFHKVDYVSTTSETTMTVCGRRISNAWIHAGDKQEEPAPVFRRCKLCVAWMKKLDAMRAQVEGGSE